MFTWYYFVIALACGSCNYINFQNIPCFPWSHDAPCSCNDLFTIFIAKSRTNANCYVFDGCTVLKTLSKVWRMQLRFLGMDCYLHSSWRKNQDKFFYIFLLLEHFSTYVVVSIYDKDLFWKRAIQKSRIELHNLSIYMIFSQQEQDIFYWNFCFSYFSDKPFDSLVQHFVQQFYAISALLHLD